MTIVFRDINIQKIIKISIQYSKIACDFYILYSATKILTLAREVSFITIVLMVRVNVVKVQLEQMGFAIHRARRHNVKTLLEIHQRQAPMMLVSLAR